MAGIRTLLLCGVVATVTLRAAGKAASLLLRDATSEKSRGPNPRLTWELAGLVESTRQLQERGTKCAISSASHIPVPGLREVFCALMHDCHLGDGQSSVVTLKCHIDLF